MKKRGMFKPNLFLSLLIGVFLSMVVSKIVYFGFTPNYAADIFSHPAFNLRFQHDVYQYRVLCKYMLFAIDKSLEADIPNSIVDPRLNVGTPGSSYRFYIAFYYLNTFFLVLTSIMTALLVHLKGKLQFSDAEKLLIVFLVPMVIGLTEFTVCFYDVSSYFFQLLILFLYLQFVDRYFWATMMGIAILVIVSTTNRESSALSVSLIAVLLLTRFGLTKRVGVGVAMQAISFLVTYWALHYFIVDPKHWGIYNIDVGQYLSDTNLMGIFFWVLFFILPMSISRSVENRWLIGAFFLASLPYVYTCLKGGVLWEIRLYVPLFLASLFLSNLDVSSHAVRLSSISLQTMMKRFSKEGRAS